MTRQYLEQINPNDLKSMPNNKFIYGDVTEGLDTLADSIKERGILAPIVVTSKRYIADGHRRQAAAIRLGLTRVPCFVSERETVEEAIEDFLACQMTEREKTPEQMARLNEYHLNRSTTEQESDPVVSGPIGTKTSQPEKRGEGRPKKDVKKADIENQAAQASGLGSRTTARRAAKVVKAIDEAEQSGDTQTAEELREALNTQSVHAATKKLEEIQQKDDTKPVDEAGKPIPDELLEVFAKRDLFKAVLNAAKTVKAALNTLCEEENDFATIRLNKTQAGNDLKNFLQQVSHAIPHAVCPYCKGKGTAKGGGCQVCKGAGWLVKSAYTSVPEDLR